MHSRRCVVGALATLVTVGCASSEQAPADESDASDQAAVSTPEVVRAGARLKPRLWNGPGAAEFAVFRDKVLGMDCDFQETAAGDFRCLPRVPQSEGLFLFHYLNDATCGSAPLVTAAPPLVFISALSDSRLPSGDLEFVGGKVGAEVAYENATLYRMFDGECTEYETEATGTLRRFEQLPMQRFVRATKVNLPPKHANRIAERVFRGDDGSQAPVSSLHGNLVTTPGTYGDFFTHNFVDLGLGGVDVGPTRTRWRNPFATEIAWTGSIGRPSPFEYAEASCTKPVLRVESPIEAVISTQTLSSSCEMTAQLSVPAPLTETFGFEGSTCTSQGPVSPNDDAKQAGAPIPQNHFVAGKVAPRSTSRRLTELVATSRNGGVLAVSLFDNTLRLPCYPRQTYDDPALAHCEPYALESYSYFKDEACTQRVMVTDRDAIEAQSCSPTRPQSVSLLEFGVVEVLEAGARLPDLTPLYEDLGFGDCEPASTERRAVFEIASTAVVNLAKMDLQ
jgi:hypothetical protein